MINKVTCLVESKPVNQEVSSTLYEVIEHSLMLTTGPPPLPRPLSGLFRVGRKETIYFDYDRIFLTTLLMELCSN